MAVEQLLKYGPIEWGDYFAQFRTSHHMLYNRDCDPDSFLGDILPFTTPYSQGNPERSV